MPNSQSESEEVKEDETIRRTIAGNIKASLLTNIFYLGTRLCIPPIVLSYISLAEYGLWSYCFIILSYLGMGVFGVTNVYVRYTAIYFAKNKYERINRLLSTGVISIAAVSLLLLVALWEGIPWLLDAFNVSSELRETAFVLIVGTTVIFMAELSIGAFTYVLQSLQLIVAEKMIWMLSFTIESILIIVLLVSGFGVYSLLWAFAIRTVISLTASYYVAKKKLPTLSISPRHLSQHMLKLFLSFGGIVQIAGLLGIANRSIKKVLAGTFISLEATGLYEVGEKFPVMALNLPGSVTAVFLPAVSQFHATKQDEKIVQVYVKGARLINLLTGSMMGFMAAFSTPLIHAWLGFNPAYQVAASILSWFTIAYQMDTLTGPASAIYRAINQPARELYYGFTQLFTTLAAAAAVFSFYGPSIEAINVSAATMMVISALAYLFISNRYFYIKQTKYALSVLIPGLYPYAIGYLLWGTVQRLFEGLSRLDTLWLFLGSLATYIIIWTPILYWGICDRHERKDIRRYLLRKVKKLS